MELKLKLSNKVFPTPQKNALKGKKFNFNILYTELFSNCKLGTIQKLHIPLRGRGRSPKDYRRENKTITGWDGLHQKIMLDYKGV